MKKVVLAMTLVLGATGLTACTGVTSKTEITAIDCRADVNGKPVGNAGKVTKVTYED